MQRPPPPRDETRGASHEVEEQVEELGDPEASPSNPAAALAVGAAPKPAGPFSRTGTSAEIWTLAWPVMLSMTLASAIGLADIAMVGRLGAIAQAAVGYAAQLFFVAQSALFALSFACVALMARAIGAGQPAEARRALAASTVVAVGVALALLVAIAGAPEVLMGWLSAEPAVVVEAVPYLRLVMLSTVLMAICLTIESALRADKDTRTPMRIAAVITVVKVTLNGVFIFGWLGGPALGVVGAGWATLVSQVVALGLFLMIPLRRERNEPTALRAADFRGLRPLVRPLIRIALPGIAERLVMNVAMVTYFAFIGTYGTAAAAAYTIGIRILSFTWIPGTGYSQAVATLVGQSLGAGDPVGAERAGWRAARLALGTALVMGLLGVVTREPLANLFTVDPETAAHLLPFMLCLSVAQPAMQLHFTLGGAFRGAGDTLTPLYAALLGNWVFRVPLAFLAARWFDLPILYLWMVLILDHVARAIWLSLGFRSGRWRRDLT
jgi:putative MATE family efflux protein